MPGYEKPDFWSRKARSEGYPARSVYKLEEMDAKFHLFKPGIRVLDIGAAPGSWSLWILKRLNGSGFLAAVDLQPLRIKETEANFLFIKGNLHDEGVRQSLLEKGPYNLVLSDAAPGTTGHRALDQGQSEAIVESVIEYAEACLKPGGAMIAKIFQSGAEEGFLKRLKGRFTLARGFKPLACRQKSFETYLVALGFKG